MVGWAEIQGNVQRWIHLTARYPTWPWSCGWGTLHIKRIRKKHLQGSLLLSIFVSSPEHLVSILGPTISFHAWLSSSIHSLGAYLSQLNNPWAARWRNHLIQLQALILICGSSCFTMTVKPFMWWAAIPQRRSLYALAQLQHCSSSNRWPGNHNLTLSSCWWPISLLLNRPNLWDCPRLFCGEKMSLMLFLCS